MIHPIFDKLSTVFREKVWEKAKMLVVGAILTPGERTVTACLHTMGMQDDPHFSNYHRVLNRDQWSSFALARILLHLLITTFLPTERTLVFGIDETLERRRGRKISKLGIYRDAVRSSKQQVVKASGLRWICLMVMTPIPWAKRTWALPFLTVLAPSPKYHEEQGKPHKTLSQWAGQMILSLRRWLPDHDLVVTGDSSYAVFDLLDRCQRMDQPVKLVTRLRLDAALYDPAPDRTGKPGRPRKKGERQPTLQHRLADETTVWELIEVPWYNQTQRWVHVATGKAIWYTGGKPAVPIRWVLVRDAQPDAATTFAPMALLCTEDTCTAKQIITWYVLRWQTEVTLHETRTHLGVETQRQWSDLAIERTTPAVLGLFSLVTLCANALIPDHDLTTRTAAWYPKALPTFSDTIAFVRKHLWSVSHESIFSMSVETPDMVKIPQSLLDRLLETVAYAA
jgi:hypothetical protein